MCILYFFNTFKVSFNKSQNETADNFGAKKKSEVQGVLGSRFGWVWLVLSGHHE